MSPDQLAPEGIAEINSLVQDQARAIAKAMGYSGGDQDPYIEIYESQEEAKRAGRFLGSAVMILDLENRDGTVSSYDIDINLV